MKRILTGEELEISDKVERSAERSRKRREYIAFVYFIIYRKRIIYVGCTINPHTRETNHSTTFNKKGLKKYTIIFVGPFELDLATKIESYEISSRANSKYLLNKRSKKQIYGKEFSVKNFRQKSLSYIRKGGEVKTMVCEHPY